MESIKNRERKSNRFVMCFKPIDMGHRTGSVKSAAVPARINSWNRDTVFVCDADSGDDSKDSVKMKIKLSRILKAVLFESSLAKKMQTRRSRENSFRSSSSLSTASEKSISQAVLSSPPSYEELDEYAKPKSNTISSTTKTKLGRSKSSSIGSRTRLVLEKNNLFRSNSMDRVKIKRRNENDWNYCLCLLLVSLCVLVLWGKVCAIFCTCAWIFFVAHRGTGHLAPEYGVSLSEFDSLEYKKRVIMEGLLGRNRSRVL